MLPNPTVHQRAASTYSVVCTAVSSCAASAEQDRGVWGLARTLGRLDGKGVPETDPALPCFPVADLCEDYTKLNALLKFLKGWTGTAQRWR